MTEPINVVVTQPVVEGSLVLIDDAIDFGEGMMESVMAEIARAAGHKKFTVIWGNMAAGENIKVIGPEEWVPAVAEVLRPLMTEIVRDILKERDATGQ